MIKNLLRSTLIVGILATSFTACKDDDCTELTWYQDLDGDGFGNPNVSLSACDQPEGYVQEGTDLDDNSTLITNTKVWSGADFTFNKAGNADWTLPANQDRITDNVTFTRQGRSTIYNYQWWQDEFGEDAAYLDLCNNFWTTCSPAPKTFDANGGTQGVKWAILDDTGSSEDWTGFNFYGTLGDPTHFYSFHNIATMIDILEAGNASTITGVEDDFEIQTSGGNTRNVNPITQIVGKKLAIWLVEDDVYLTFTFTEWGDNNSGGALSYTRSTQQ